METPASLSNKRRKIAIAGSKDRSYRGGQGNLGIHDFYIHWYRFPSQISGSHSANQRPDLGITDLLELKIQPSLVLLYPLVNIHSWFSPFSASWISRVSLHMLSVMSLSFISYLKVIIALKFYVFSNVPLAFRKKPSDFILFMITVSPKLFKCLKHCTDPCFSFYQYQSEFTLYKF